MIVLPRKRGNVEKTVLFMFRKEGKAIFCVCGMVKNDLPRKSVFQAAEINGCMGRG